MEPFRDENELIAELSALRPTPRPAFAAALDERAAAGFPRRRPPVAPAFAHLAARVKRLPSRGLVLAGGGAALAAIVATGAAMLLGPGRGPELHLETGQAPQASKAGGGGTEKAVGEALKPSPPVKPPAHRVKVGDACEIGSAGCGANGRFNGEFFGPTSAAGSTGTTKAEVGVPQLSREVPLSNWGASHRDVERSAQIVLGAEPSQVAADAAKVAETAHAYDGIVMRSSTRGGSEGAGASFDLLIPTAKLGDAMASLARIGEVRLRHEASADITAPTVSVSERLRESRATIDGLLTRLAAAETESEREVVEAELAIAQRQRAALRSRLASLQRRAHLSRVSVRIEADSGPASSGGWGVDDAFHDAGHVLSVAAGAAVLAIAVLAPLALIALLAWLGRRAWIRRGRERALD